MGKLKFGVIVVLALNSCSSRAHDKVVVAGQRPSDFGQPDPNFDRDPEKFRALLKSPKIVFLSPSLAKEFSEAKLVDLYQKKPDLFSCSLGHAEILSRPREGDTDPKLGAGQDIRPFLFIDKNSRKEPQVRFCDSLKKAHEAPQS